LRSTSIPTSLISGWPAGQAKSSEDLYTEKPPATARHMRGTLFIAAVGFTAAQRNDDIDRIVDAYSKVRMNPELFDGRKGWARFLDPALMEAISHSQMTGSRTQIDSLLREETPGVYSFQLVSEEFCNKFLEELDHYYSTGLPVSRPNSMNNCDDAEI
jgi:hypothetical protein